MRQRPLTFFFLATALISVFLFYTGRLEIHSYPFGEGEEVTLEGTVSNLELSGSGYRILMNRIRNGDQASPGLKPAAFPENMTLLLYPKAQKPLKIGNRIQVTGTVQYPSRASNPGQFDQKSYEEAKGISFHLYQAEIQILSDRVDLPGQILFSIRSYCYGILKRLATEEEAGVMGAMLLGERSGLEDEQKMLFQTGGISHILAISGLHISLLGKLFYQFLRKCRFSYGLSALLAGALMLFYLALTGFGVSAKRAVLMFFLFLLAEYLGRTYDMLSALSLSGSLILLEDPRMLFQCSFQLSFLSVAAVGILFPLLKKGDALDNLRSGLSVFLVTTPCVLYWFFEVAPYGLLLNLLVIPLMPFLFLPGLFGLIAGSIFLPAGVLIFAPVHYLLMLFNGLCELAGNLAGSRLVLGQPSLPEIFLYYALLILACAGKKRCFLMVPLILMLLRGELFVSSVPYVTFLDVGQGDGIFLSLPGARILIDGGSTTENEVGRYRILPYLKSQGVQKLDFVFLSHMDEDHVGGVEELLSMGAEGIPIRHLVMTPAAFGEEKGAKIRNTAEQKGVKVSSFSDGSALRGKNWTLTCLYPGKTPKEEGSNENSMVLFLEIEGKTFLFPGDLEGDGEDILRANGKIQDLDVLKVAHHGSANSTSQSFLAWTSPKLSILSYGEGNRYGHPAGELLERLREAKSRILSTAEEGAVTVWMEEEGMKATGYLKDREESGG